MWDLRSLLPLSFFPLGCPVHSCVHALHSVCLCLCQYVFSRIVGKYMHACAKCFNFQSYAFSLTCLFSERATVKSCIEHQTQQLMFSAGYSISHQGSGLGVYFMAFPVQSSETGNEKAAKDSLIISKAKGYCRGPRIVLLFWVDRMCVCTRVHACVLLELSCWTWQIQMHMLMGALRWWVFPKCHRQCEEGKMSQLQTPLSTVGFRLIFLAACWEEEDGD